MNFIKYYLIFLLGISTALTANSQTNTSMKFDFGNGNAAKGYTKVTESSFYTKSLGYGFLPGASLKAINRNGKNLLKTDFITSDKPFYFTVDIPEGNYNVKVILGDEKGTSLQTVRAECRRLMLPKFETIQGKIEVRKFTVHVRYPQIANTSDQVKLKPRELNYLHWDKQLTLEFNGSSPKVCAIEIEQADKPITVFLAGNSTVVDQAEEPYAAWGQIIPSFFKPEKVVIANYAESGEALSSFISSNRLQKILSEMKKGDYLFIEFGHNDQKQKGEGIGAFTSYKRDLKYFISEARKKGGIPVLITSMHRRNFDSTGLVIHTLGDYPAAVRQTAKEEQVPLIDLNNMSKTLYEAWGPINSEKAFVIYPANSFPNQPKELRDNTHFNPYGADQIARCIIRGIKENRLGLAAYLRKDLKDFDPSKPDKAEDFYWPLSPGFSAAKPDGN